MNLRSAASWLTAKARAFSFPSKPLRRLLAPRSACRCFTFAAKEIRTRRGSSSQSCCRNTASVPWPNTSLDRKSTRLNSSHITISYAVFCLKKKKKKKKKKKQKIKKKKKKKKKSSYNSQRRTI